MENMVIQLKTNAYLVTKLVLHVLDLMELHANLVFQKDILKIQHVFHNAQMDYGKILTFGDVMLVILHAKLVKDLVQTNVHHAPQEAFYLKPNA